jgi:hypothetical protein
MSAPVKSEPLKQRTTFSVKSGNMRAREDCHELAKYRLSR